MSIFRDRLGTGCTKDSKDSGIDVRRKTKKHNRKKISNVKKKSAVPATIYEEDDNDSARQTLENLIVFGLWFLVLHCTNLMFGLPFKIMLPVRTNHVLVALSYLLVGIWSICAFCFYLKKNNDAMRWSKTSPTAYFCAWLAMFFGMLFFYVATYPQLLNWSLLIIAFYFSFFVTVDRTFL